MVFENTNLDLLSKYKLMERLKLSNGLIAIGYGGTSNSLDQTNFSLLLANRLAKNENVLFLNWNNYSRKLNSIIKNLGVEKNEKLEINTSVGFFGIASFLSITESIEESNYTTIFLDNVLSFASEEYKISEPANRDLLIKALKFIVDRYSVRIVFNVTIDPEMFSYTYYEHENVIDLAYFKWSRKIINECEQVIALQNLEGSINRETYEHYNKNTFKVFNLKNKNDEMENYILTL